MCSPVYPRLHHPLLHYIVPFYKKVLTLHKGPHFTKTFFTLQRSLILQKSSSVLQNSLVFCQRVLHLQTSSILQKGLYRTLLTLQNVPPLWRKRLHIAETSSLRRRSLLFNKKTFILQKVSPVFKREHSRKLLTCQNGSHFPKMPSLCKRCLHFSSESLCSQDQSTSRKGSSG